MIRRPPGTATPAPTPDPQRPASAVRKASREGGPEHAESVRQAHEASRPDLCPGCPMHLAEALRTDMMAVRDRIIRRRAGYRDPAPSFDDEAP